MRLLRMTAHQRLQLTDLIIRPDGLEAVAVALCGRQVSLDRTAYTVRSIIPIPIEACVRAVDSVRWPTRKIYDALGRCQAEDLVVLKLHSHPAGAAFFSTVDDASDSELLSAVARRIGGEQLSAVFTHDGQILARTVNAQGDFAPIDRIVVVGDEISVLDRSVGGPARDFDLRHRQMFGSRTTELLSRLTIGIVGTSGTGSPVVEMLARLGVGRLVLVDDDKVEVKNLNRIYGTTRRDADERASKVKVIAAFVDNLGLGVEVEPFAQRVDAPEAWAALSVCDIVFGCMDSVEGRDHLNRLATMATLPYFDLGVRLDADGEGGVESVSGVVHYLQPGGSSLKSRGVYSDEDVYAEHLSRTEPGFYADQVRRGYIRGIAVDRPAVISINTALASTAVNEMLARLHPFRTRPNHEFAVQRLLISHGRMMQAPEGAPDELLAQLLGAGAGAGRRARTGAAA